ncbi:unnamed protein product, partial [Heterotrigona itama]
PIKPDLMNWSSLYPFYFPTNKEESKKQNISQKHVEFVDIGCGYGGLLVTLSSMFPDKLILGMEIRVKVSDYVMDRIAALRSQNPGQYQNIACLRTNAMKYLPNYFYKGQLKKMFFLYPDPHFKKSKHKWRIINKTLLAEYAYVLAEGVMYSVKYYLNALFFISISNNEYHLKAIVYTVTDVKDLHEWIVEHFHEHPLFDAVSKEELDKDPIVEKLYESTEEGQKVTRNKGCKFLAVFKRIPDPFEKKIN